MVNTKRRIEKETDRFGGYASEIGRSPIVSEYDNIYTNPPSAIDKTVITDADFNITAGAKLPPPEQEQQLYTTRFASPAAQTELPPRPQKQQQPRTQEDLLPTVKTRAYAAENEKIAENNDNASQVVRPAKRTRFALDAKTKILLCVYVVVALILAIAVIATGVSISSATAESDEIAGRIAQKQAIVAKQQSELALLGDEDVIRGKAADFGMVQASAPSMTAAEIETYEYPEATPHTNGFDEFCDWLSKVMK